MTCCSILLVLVLPPAAAAQTPEQALPDVVSLDRIRRGLATIGPVTTSTIDGSRDRPVFRLRIDESIPRDPRLTWDPSVDLAVSPVVRPRMPAAHYEYLDLVTPDEFRASTLYSGGPDLLGPTQGLLSGFRQWLRRREEEEVRRRIKEELAALKEAQRIQ